jgi:glucosyltransferase
MFYGLMGWLTHVNLEPGARDFRLMTRKYVNALLSMREYNRFSKGLFGWVGFKVKWLPYENKETAVRREQMVVYRLVQVRAGRSDWIFDVSPVPVLCIGIPRMSFCCDYLHQDAGENAVLRGSRAGIHDYPCMPDIF